MCPPKYDVVSAEEGVEEEIDGGIDDGRSVLGKSGTCTGRVRAAVLIEPGGELVGEKRSGGEV